MKPPQELDWLQDGPPRVKTKYGMPVDGYGQAEYIPDTSLRARARQRQHPETLQTTQYFKYRSTHDKSDFYAMYRVIGDEVKKVYLEQGLTVPFEYYNAHGQQQYKAINWYDLRLGEVTDKLRIHMKHFENPDWEEKALERMFKRNMDSLVDELDLAFAIRCFRLYQTNPQKLVSQSNLHDADLKSLVRRVRKMMSDAKTCYQRAGQTKKDKHLYDMQEYLKDGLMMKITDIQQDLKDKYGLDWNYEKVKRVRSSYVRWLGLNVSLSARSELKLLSETD